LSQSISSVPRGYVERRGNGADPLPSPPADPPDVADLIRFLTPLPVCPMRRGLRFLQGWMLLVGIAQAHAFKGCFSCWARPWGERMHHITPGYMSPQG
jgi:hypothetical protein